MSASPTSAAATDAGATTRLPRIVAFDLDGTLWDPELYQLRGGAPFRRDAASGAVFDAAGERMRLLGDSAKIISTITTDPAFAGVEIAYVSRTEYPEWAVPCLQTFLIPGHPDGASLFDVAPFQEIYPGSKLKHFRRIHEESGVPYESMLFYDNESWNVKEVSKLGVKCVYTPRGMTAAAWQEGLAMFENSSSKKGVKARKGGR